jgi:hypothetical protein
MLQLVLFRQKALWRSNCSHFVALPYVITRPWGRLGQTWNGASEAVWPQRKNMRFKLRQYLFHSDVLTPAVLFELECSFCADLRTNSS